MDSFICWIGGKKLLRKQIVELFPEKITRYIEVFGGGGWVLFASDQHAKFEVWNDYNSDLVNLYKCVKYHAEELLRELEYMINSRELFFDYISQLDSRGLTDIQRAARFYMLIRCSYSATMDSFGNKPRNLARFKERFGEIQKRLENVLIENKDFADLLRIYDKEDTLFYLDPPYYKTEGYYQGFCRADHERLCEALKKVKSKWILSYNADPYIEELYKDFHIIKTTRNNNMTARYRENREYSELIIKNYY